MKDERVLYDSFNARYLSAEEVAETFIPNSQFEELLLNNHSLLMGPRGSGKTTILKMLSPSALHFWKGRRARETKEKIPFIGIYIPSDIQWKRQLDQINKELQNFGNYGLIISKLSVTTNVLIAISKTFYSLIEHKPNKNTQDFLLETELCKILIDAWKLKRPISPNLLAIEQSLAARIIEINSHVRKVKYLASRPDQIEYSDYFFDDYFDLANAACIAFENIYKNDVYFRDKPFRWGFCFDELEIAPDWLQKELLSYLRSRDQRFIFKLTTSPIISLIPKGNNTISGIEARQDDDYKIIRTWTHSARDIKKWAKFCNDLVGAKINRKFKKDYTPHTIFGNDNLDQSIIEALNLRTKNINYKNDFDENSPSWHLIRTLAEYDTSFYNFLIKRKINPKNPVPSHKTLKDTLFRKIKPLITFKYHFLSQTGKRSRKVYPLFYGVPYIYELCDGNPRSLIGLVDELLVAVEKDPYGIPKQLPINMQSRIIFDVSQRYLKIISSHPDANKKDFGQYISLAELLETIGKYFHEKIVQGPFSIDPVSTFIIDDKVDPNLLQLLELALHLGAIIYVDPSEGLSETGLINKKFRLSYLLTPVFKLPKREYNAVKLSTIISKNELSSKDKAKSHQIKLF